MNTIPVGLSSENYQCEHIRELLDDVCVSRFVSILNSELKALKSTTPTFNENKIVEFIIKHIAKDSIDSVQQILYAIRAALNKLPSNSLTDELRRKSENVACALYCLTACKWVNLSFFKTEIHEQEKCRYISRIPIPTPYKAPDSSENETSAGYLINIRIICAVIATAIYGGKIELVPSSSKANPFEPKHYYPVKTDNAGDDILASIETAFYKALLGQTEASVINAVKASKLEQHERIRLEERLKSIRRIDHITPTLIILDPISQPVAFVQFADQYCTPVMLPTPHETARILEVSPDLFVVQFEELWRDLSNFKQAKQTHIHTSQPGDDAMKPTSGNIHVSNNTGIVNINNNAQNSQINQAKTSISSLQQSYSEPDARELFELIKEVRAQITNLPSLTEAGKTNLTTHVSQIESELEKKEGADKDKIKKSFTDIEAIANAVAGGTKLLSACEALGSKIGSLIGNYL